MSTKTIFAAVFVGMLAFAPAAMSAEVPRSTQPSGSDVTSSAVQSAINDARDQAVRRAREDQMKEQMQRSRGAEDASAAGSWPDGPVVR